MATMFADHHVALSEAVRAQLSAVPQGWVGLAAVAAGVLMCAPVLVRRTRAALPIRRRCRTGRSGPVHDESARPGAPRPWHFGNGGLDV